MEMQSVPICKALHEAGCLKSSKKQASGKWRFFSGRVMTFALHRYD
jgi:hypothetical protein